MQRLTHNNTAQQQDAFHQLSGAGVQCTLLQQQWDKGEKEGNPLPFEMQCLRDGAAFPFFKLVREWCRLNLLFRENGQSKHWRTWPGQPTEQEQYCRSASLNQCSSLLAGDRFQKHLDYTLKGLSHRCGSHTIMLLCSLHTCIVCYIFHMVNKC